MSILNVEHLNHGFGAFSKANMMALSEPMARENRLL